MLFHFPSDNDQHPEDIFDLILEKSPLEKQSLWGNFCRREVLMFICCCLDFFSPLLMLSETDFGFGKMIILRCCIAFLDIAFIDWIVGGVEV